MARESGDLILEHGGAARFAAARRSSRQMVHGPASAMPRRDWRKAFEGSFSLMPMKTAIDDLPSVSVSRMRALGEITAADEGNERQVRRGCLQCRDVAAAVSEWRQLVVFPVPLRSAREDPAAV